MGTRPHLQEDMEGQTCNRTGLGNRTYRVNSDKVHNQDSKQSRITYYNRPSYPIWVWKLTTCWWLVQTHGLPRGCFGIPRPLGVGFALALYGGGLMVAPAHDRKFGRYATFINKKNVLSLTFMYYSSINLLALNFLVY